MACPAAIVYRNYFANEAGASVDKELDCLEMLGELVNNKDEKYWSMSRGFCLPLLDTNLVKLSTTIANDADFERKVEEKVQVGVHWSTEVSGGSHDVSQVICSALPVAYMKSKPASDWEGFAASLLEAAFDATLTVAAILAAQEGKRKKVFLTAVGGGELGNRQKWICQALDKALHTHEKEPLDVMLVHYSDIPTCYISLTEGRDPDEGLEGAEMSHTIQINKLKKSTTFITSSSELGNDDASALANAFAHFDTNGDGVIDKAEMKKILHGIDEDFFTDHVVNILFKEADCDGDGAVHYTEFVNWMCSEDEDIAAAILEGVSHCPSTRKNLAPA
jgi:hypothetical protein